MREVWQASRATRGVRGTSWAAHLLGKAASAASPLDRSTSSPDGTSSPDRAGLRHLLSRPDRAGSAAPPLPAGGRAAGPIARGLRHLLSRRAGPTTASVRHGRTCAQLPMLARRLAPPLPILTELWRGHGRGGGNSEIAMRIRRRETAKEGAGPGAQAPTAPTLGLRKLAIGVAGFSVL